MPVKRKEIYRPPLPHPPAAAADAIERFLIEKYGIRRPPEVTARVLACIVALHETGEPFPVRGHLAKHLNCSAFTIDAAISAALERGLIEESTRTQRGNVARRDSIIRRRVYTPDDELVRVYHSAARRPAVSG